MEIEAYCLGGGSHDRHLRSERQYSGHEMMQGINDINRQEFEQYEAGGLIWCGAAVGAGDFLRVGIA